LQGKRRWRRGRAEPRRDIRYKVIKKLFMKKGHLTVQQKDLTGKEVWREGLGGEGESG